MASPISPATVVVLVHIGMNKQLLTAAAAATASSGQST
jgi:hypothetical protein